MLILAFILRAGFVLLLSVSTSNYANAKAIKKLEEQIKMKDEILANVDTRISNDQWAQHLIDVVSNSKSKLSSMKKELRAVKKPIDNSAPEEPELDDLVKVLTGSPGKGPKMI